MPYQQKHSGFTLLELILVVVLLGVLASGAGLLISTPIEAYNDQLRRQQLVDQAEMALRQIALDVRRALPNSLRTNGDALEMINTVDGARYRDEVGGDYTGPGDWLDFSAADDSFNILGLLQTGALIAGHRLVIYNTAPDNIYTDITDTLTPNAGIVTSAATTLTLSSKTPTNDDAEHSIGLSPNFLFTQHSPGQRIFVVDGPISYVCNETAGTITRYDNYPYQSTQKASETALSGLTDVKSGPVVTQLSACNISYDPGTAQRGGLVTLAITIADTTGESISLLHQIHVINAP